jgi:5-methylcytosine-specific restriction endonuclease McrA
MIEFREPTARKAPSKKMKAEVMLRQAGLCAGCQCKLLAPEYDHIVPLYCGGDHAVGNLQALCAACHSTKTRRDNVEAKKGSRIRRKHFGPPKGDSTLRGRSTWPKGRKLRSRNNLRRNADERMGKPDDH